MLHADVRQDFVRVMIGCIDELPAAEVNAGFAALDEQAIDDACGREGFERW